MIKSFNPNELELSAADVAQKVKIPKPTAYRMLATLAYGGFIEQSPKTGKYRIGPVLYTMGSLYLSTTDLLRAAEAVFKTLNDLTTEVVSMGILDRGNFVFVMKEESKHAVRIYQHIGSIIPAYALAMGRALLSELTDAEIDSLYPKERLRPITKKTIATKTELKLELEQIRKTGISFDSEGSYIGVEGIASLIWDASGKAVAAMSFAIPIFRMNRARREQFATLIKLGSSLISYRLGYQDMVNPVRDIQEILSWWEKNQLAPTH